MTGDVERHLFTIDGLQIEVGHDDCFAVEDRFDDIFPIGPTIRKDVADEGVFPKRNFIVERYCTAFRFRSVSSFAN